MIEIKETRSRRKLTNEKPQVLIKASQPTKMQLAEKMKSAKQQSHDQGERS